MEEVVTKGQLHSPALIEKRFAISTFSLSLLIGGSIGGIGEGVFTGCRVLGTDGGGRDGTVRLPADVERRGIDKIPS
ncbi:hypothetical protein H5410_041871 [Solanum commersonii]|uniref:Uncharacterized protein n=1 Tax=Solanum commersonii TaxID=4109 RepID=A0A9J5XU47_SOLCO|nr:hypothetical protein H5410_041871 [Solanum commersonii]